MSHRAESGSAFFSKVQRSPAGLPAPVLLLQLQVFTMVLSSFPFVLGKTKSKQNPAGDLDTEQHASAGVPVFCEHLSSGTSTHASF